MKITKIQLRSKVRRIILESIEEKAKIIDGVLTGIPENINSFLDLADTFGYINDLGYEVEPPTSFFPEEQHTWYFEAEPEFGELLLTKYNQRPVDEYSKIIEIFSNQAFLKRTGKYSIEIATFGNEVKK